MPESIEWREAAVELLLEYGDPDGAIHAAREGVRVYPNGAFLWLLLAKTLAETGVTPQCEIESCLRRSLALNVGLFEAADNLAMFLVAQHRHDEAKE